MQVSVCMASYNGERFIGEQLSSILDQIGPEDEVVVVDDCSSDQTVELLNSFNDKRVRVHRHEVNKGVNASFATAIEMARHEFVVFSDQDDIWTPDRLKAITAPFADRRVNVVAANYHLIDSHGASLGEAAVSPLTPIDDTRRFYNLLRIFRGRMNYYGCAMAMRRTFSRRVLPYPAGLECHDIWIAMLANLDHSIRHLSTTTLLHRVHGGNASIIKRSLLVRISVRAVLLLHLLIALMRTVGIRLGPDSRSDTI